MIVLPKRSDSEDELGEGKKALFITLIEVALDVEVEPIDSEGKRFPKRELRDPTVFIRPRLCEEMPRLSPCALETYMELRCGSTEAEVKNMGA